MIQQSNNKAQMVNIFYYTENYKGLNEKLPVEKVP